MKYEMITRNSHKELINELNKKENIKNIHFSSCTADNFEFFFTVLIEYLEVDKCQN